MKPLQNHSLLYIKCCICSNIAVATDDLPKKKLRTIYEIFKFIYFENFGKFSRLDRISDGNLHLRIVASTGAVYASNRVEKSERQF